MMHYYGWGMGRPFGGFGFGWVLGIVFWVFLGFLLVILLKKLFAHKSYGHFEDDEEGDMEALDILKKRYAKGEITKKEFESIKKDIN